jgi:anaerobic ribonucleoside-triphosphate reductase activating protein
MNYIKIRNADIADGPGIRVAVYASGCRNRCPGCHNAESWDFAAGKPWTEKEKESVLRDLEKPYIAGLSILGGEPFEEENQKDLADLAEEAKRRSPDKTIWIWTGYSLKDLLPGGRKRTEHTDRLLGAADALITEPFLIGERDVSSANIWRGSRNQKILDARKSAEEGREIPLEGAENAIWPDDERERLRKR